MVTKNKLSPKKNIVGDLLVMNVNDLQTHLIEARQKLFNQRFSHAVAQLEKTSELKKSKRQIARILTVLQGKKA